MKKWNEKIRQSQCLEEAFDTFTSYISENDEFEDDLEELESSLEEKISNEDGEYLWVKGADLQDYKTMHSYKYDDIEDEQLFQGVIVVVKFKGQALIVDGNHRVNTIKDHYPNLLVYLVVFDL